MEHEFIPRVCILLEAYPPRVGGTPTHARLLAEDLAAAGAGVTVVTRRWERGTPARESQGGIRIRRIGPRGFGPWKKWGLLFTALPALWAVRRETDVIYVPGFRVLGVAAVVMGRLLGKKVVLRGVSCGEMSGAFFKAGLDRARVKAGSWPVRVMLALRNAVLRRADAFVAISRDVEAELLAEKVPPAVIHRIPNGVDTHRFAPVDGDAKVRLREELGLPREGVLAVYTGRLVRYKGLPRLLEVWRGLAAERPDAHLVLVGSGGNDLDNCEDALRRTAEEPGLAGRVLFRGDVDNVEAYLQASDLFVFPTENEAFGISLIEAMACGLPAVSTRASGPRDIIEDEKNGLAYEAGDDEALAAAIRRLLDEPGLARVLGRQALADVQARYAREIVAGEYLGLFRRLVGG